MSKQQVSRCKLMVEAVLVTLIAHVFGDDHHAMCDKHGIFFFLANMVNAWKS